MDQAWNCELIKSRRRRHFHRSTCSVSAYPLLPPWNTGNSAAAGINRSARLCHRSSAASKARRATAGLHRLALHGLRRRIFLLGESFAACVGAAGRCIRSRTCYWFVFVMACLQCGFFPFGTVLGVFTIVVLSRPSVKEMFGLSASEQQTLTILTRRSELIDNSVPIAAQRNRPPV